MCKIYSVASQKGGAMILKVLLNFVESYNIRKIYKVVGKQQLLVIVNNDCIIR